jgi:hypothetical protein
MPTLHTFKEALGLRNAVPKGPRTRKQQDPDFLALNAILDRIRTRFHNPTTFAQLTHGEQLVHDVGFVLDAEVLNGGWHQFLSNSSGDEAERDKSYLREVGALAVLRLLERVSSLFPNGVIPTDRTLRNQELRKASETDPAAVDGLLNGADAEYYREREQLYAHLMDYVERHEADFRLPDDAAVRRSVGSSE